MHLRNRVLLERRLSGVESNSSANPVALQLLSNCNRHSDVPRPKAGVPHKRGRAPHGRAPHERTPHKRVIEEKSCLKKATEESRHCQEGTVQLRD